jgi:chaperone modulatory protein CbpM
MILTGRNLDEEIVLNLTEMCRACQVHAEYIMDLVEEGILEPEGRRREPLGWQFPGSSLKRARIALRLQRDLDINLAGVALALDLLDEIEELRRRVRRFEG